MVYREDSGRNQVKMNYPAEDIEKTIDNLYEGEANPADIVALAPKVNNWRQAHPDSSFLGKKISSDQKEFRDLQLFPAMKYAGEALTEDVVTDARIADFANKHLKDVGELDGIPEGPLHWAKRTGHKYSKSRN